MFFEDYKKQRLANRISPVKQLSLSDFNIHRYSLKECQKIDEKVRDYYQKINKAKSVTINVVTIWVIIGFISIVANPEELLIDVLRMLVVTLLIGFFTYKVTSRNAIKPTEKEKEISNNYTKFKNKKFRLELKEKDYPKKIYRNFIKDDLYQLNKLKNEADKLHEEKRDLEKELDAIDHNQLKKLKKVSPTKFEKYVHHLFSKMGYKTELTSASGDGGVDIILKDEQEKIYVQCKRYDGTVSSPDVKQFLGTLTHDEVSQGIYVTTGRFSDNAEQVAVKADIELIDGNELVELMENVLGEEQRKRQIQKRIQKKEKELEECYADMLDLPSSYDKEDITNHYNRKINEMEQNSSFGVGIEVTKRKRILNSAYRALS